TGHRFNDGVQDEEPGLGPVRVHLPSEPCGRLERPPVRAHRCREVSFPSRFASVSRYARQYLARIKNKTAMPTRISSSVVTSKIQKLLPKAVETRVSWRSASRPSEAGMIESAIAIAGPHPGIRK